MKDQNPVQNSNSTQFIKVKYKGELDNDRPVGTKNNMIDALRGDMRRATDGLLSAHYVLSEITKSDKPINGEKLAEIMLRYVEKCLASLDCTDHINPRDIEANFIENTNDELIDECERISELINEALNEDSYLVVEYLEMQYEDLSEEIDRREADDDKIENTTEALEEEETRLAIEVYRSDYLPIIQNQYIDVVEENNRRKYGKIKNTTEALESEVISLTFELENAEHSVLSEYEDNQNKLNDVQQEFDRRQNHANINIVGIITAIRKITTRKGQQMAIMTLDSGVDIVVFPRILEKLRDDIKEIEFAKVAATFNCQDSDDDRDEYYLNSIVGFERIENTVDDLIDECERISEEINDLINEDSYLIVEHLEMQYEDLSEEIYRRQAHYGKIENTTEALESEAERLKQLSDEYGNKPCGSFSDKEFDDYVMFLNQLAYVKHEIDRREAAQDAIIRDKFSGMTEYDLTDYFFCDDCGRANCICDGAIDGWSE